MNEMLEQQMRSPTPNKKGMEREVGQIKQLYQGSFSWSGPGRMIHGRVTDETGRTAHWRNGHDGHQELNGVTVTDIDGYYSLVLPEGGEN